MATFFAARKHLRRNIERLMSIIKTVDACVTCSVRCTTKSSASIFTGTFGPSRTIELKRVSFRSIVREGPKVPVRSEEHTSELQSLTNLVCRLLLEKKNINRVC